MLFLKKGNAKSLEMRVLENSIPNPSVLDTRHLSKLNFLLTFFIFTQFSTHFSLGDYLIKLNNLSVMNS